MELKKLKTGNTVASIVDDINANTATIEEFSETVVTNNGNQVIDGALTVKKSDVEGSGDLTVQGNLNVAGTTTTKDAETLLIKDNMIVTNSEGEAVSSLSGIAIRKNAEETYGIAYDPTDDTVKLGLGTLSLDGEFVFNEGQGLPVAVRQLSETANGNLVVWNEEQHALVDSGVSPDGIGMPDNMVTTDTAQTITGVKTFNSGALRVDRIKAKSSGDELLIFNGMVTKLGTKTSTLGFYGDATRPTYAKGSNSEKELALLEDIPEAPDLTNMVTTDTAQTISGEKRIENNKLTIQGGVRFAASDDTQYGETMLRRDSSSGSLYVGNNVRALYFDCYNRPKIKVDGSYKDAATLSDIPTVPDTSNLVTTDTAQTITGEKIFSGNIRIVSIRDINNNPIVSSAAQQVSFGHDYKTVRLFGNKQRPTYKQTVSTGDITTDIALISDIPDTSSFAQKSYVDDQINANKVEIIRVGF